MDLKEFMENSEKSGSFNIEEMLRLARKENKTAFINFVDDPDSPEGKAMQNYIDSHHLLPPNYLDITGDEIEAKGAKLFEADTTIKEKRSILMLLAHQGVYEAFKILKKYRENPDPDLVVWANMALEECETFCKQNLSEDALVSLSILAKTGRNEPCPCGSGKKFKKCCGKGL